MELFREWLDLVRYEITQRREEGCDVGAIEERIVNRYFDRSSLFHVQWSKYFCLSKSVRFLLFSEVVEYITL